jgi:NADH:ubiquinone oxidoreductase subunit 6 (subunit J)
MAKNIARTALSLLIVALYVAGLFAMFAKNVRLGIDLWVISTLGGIGLLYWIHVMKKRAEDADKIARGMPYGDPDDPAAPVNPVVPKENDGR